MFLRTLCQKAVPGNWRGVGVVVVSSHRRSV